MTQVADTHDRFDLATTGDNVRESLADMIHNISPTETPFLQMCSRGTAKSNYEEWLIDSLADAADNKQIDGDSFANTALNAAERLGNYCQIAWKVIGVSRRAEKLTKAGRKSETAYQLAKIGKELKRDKEFILTGAGGSVVAAAGNSTTAGTVAGLNSWLRTNTSRGGSGVDPALTSTTYGYPDTAAVDGTDRALDESAILDVVKDCYVAGGNPSCLMVGPTAKQKISQYLFSSTARVATQYQDQGKSPSGGVTAAGAIDIWVTDFGAIEIVPNRFQREDDGFILDKDMWEVKYIDDMKVEDIDKTSDSTRKALICDFTLCSLQEAASGIFADIDETLAMTA